MARKRSTQAAFSLFSFQDIITSVTGIMILITLILALELVNRVESAPANQTAQQRDTTQEMIEVLRHEIAALEQSAGSEGDVDLNGLPTLDPGELARRAESLERSAADIERQIVVAQSRAGDKSREADAARRRADVQSAATRERIENIQKSITEAEAKLARVRGRERVYFKPGDPEVTTWLIEAQETKLIVAQLGVSAPPQELTMIHELDAWARRLDPAKNDFLLLVKPGGENRAKKCETLLRDRGSGHGFHVGLQVVPAGRVVIDPKTGAGV